MATYPYNANFENPLLTWERIPHVVLLKAIQEDPWCKNKDVTISMYYTEAEFVASNKRKIPKAMAIKIPHQTTYLGLSIWWDSRHPRFQIDCTTFHHRIKQRASKSTAGVISRIKEMFSESQPALDKIISLKAEKEATEKHKKEQHASQEELFGVTFIPRHCTLWYEPLGEETTEDNYRLQLKPKHNKTHMFTINCIEGEYTVDEIKQIIKIVGTNPRVTAKRLLK